MTKSQFKLVGTGGGCTGYAYNYLPDQPYILVTSDKDWEDNSFAPTEDDEPICIGFYDSNSEAVHFMKWPRWDTLEFALITARLEHPELLKLFPSL